MLGLAGLVALSASVALGFALPTWFVEAVTIVVLSAVIGLLTSLTLFATAARSRAQSVRVLHTESPMGGRRDSSI